MEDQEQQDVYTQERPGKPTIVTPKDHKSFNPALELSELDIVKEFATSSLAIPQLDLRAHIKSP